MNVNNDWMSNVDKKTGYGNIQAEDFVKLMEGHGFRVDDVKTLDLDFKLTKEVVDGILQKLVLPSLPSIVGPEREEFFKEYISRADKLTHIVSINQFFHIFIIFSLTGL